MSDQRDAQIDPQAELRHRRIAAGDARVAVFTRTYPAAIEDVWDACTNPERLRRWYAPVTGELRMGGSFQQGPMGSGVVVACEPPRELVVSLGGGADEIQLHLTPADDAHTVLEIQHATTIDRHEIGGQMFDAIFCMGGGYYPRLASLERHLLGTLPDRHDPMTVHEDPAMRPVIDRGSAAMAALLDAAQPDGR